MTKRMLIDASHTEETRVVVLDGTRLEEFDLEAANRMPLKGNIYLARVVRVEPSLQAAFVEYGGNRHGFLAFGEIHPDYYQIPVADRQRLIELQAAEAREAEAAEDAAEAAGMAPPELPHRGFGEVPAEPEVELQYADAEAVATEATPADGADAPRADAPRADAPPADHPDPGHDPSEPTGSSAAAPVAETVVPDTVGPESFVTESFVTESVVAETFVTEAGPLEVAAAEASSFASGEAPDRGPDGGPDGGPHGGPHGSDEDGAPLANGHLPNGADGLEADAAEPPETIGGDGPEEVARERRIPSRHLRHYKIQEVIRRRQIMLVQVVKEERGGKGAALTTYISLAGRFSVLMPNSPRGGGVSRKITALADRKRLREAIEEVGLPDGMSLIVRTAGAQRPKPEIRRDCEYLLRLWDSIRERTLASSAPALIYEEADLIKRSIRDVFSRDVEEVLVDGEDAFQEAREFMRMLMPQHVRKIQLHRDGGLFARQGVEAQLDAMHLPRVELRSGGYIVINQTEALVAIDVNSGRATRERHIEDTAFRTNCEAADEIARQLRLRDLAGLIVIDFIDMESPKHDAFVERRLKDALRHDRARIQLGRISHFGLLEMSRQRLRPSLTEQTFVTCPHCAGRGQVRSLESSAVSVIRAIEEEGARRRSSEIAVHVGSPVALYLLNRKRDRLAQIEARFGMAVIFEPDATLSGPAHRIERTRAADPGRPLPAAPAALRMDYAPEVELPETEAAELPGADAPEAPAAEAGGEAEAERRRRRRRRRRGGTREGAGAGGPANGAAEDGDAEHDEAPPQDGLLPDASPDGVRPRAAGGDRAVADGDAELPAGPELGSLLGSQFGAEAPTEEPARDGPRRRRGGRGRGGLRSAAGGPAPARDEDAASSGEREAPRDPAREPMRDVAGGRPPAPRYVGPTPADPFAGHVDHIFAALEAAEAAAEAAATRPSRPRGLPGTPAEPVAAESAMVQAAGEAPLAVAGVAAAPEPQPTPEPTPVPTVATVEPPPMESVPRVAPAANGADTPAGRVEPQQGSPVQPRVLGEGEADAPKRRGWWAR